MNIMKPFFSILCWGASLGGLFPVAYANSAPPDTRLAAEEAAVLQAHSMREGAKRTRAVSTFSHPSKAVIREDARTAKPDVPRVKDSNIKPETVAYQLDTEPLPPPIPGPGTLGSAPGIPFTGDRFIASPSTSSGKLAELPPELLPLGKNKPKPEEDKNQDVKTASGEPPLYIKPKEKTAENSPPSADEETTTLSPFLRWIRATQDSQRIAKEERERYRAEAIAETDPFLTIRFPYLGTENPPPNGGSVIYSSKAE
jgi:hypothetical protein